MGLSIAISGGIITSVLVVILGIIFGISYQINTESLANTEAFEINNSLLKTNMDIKTITALSGDDTINFVLFNNGSTKLWNYNEFDLLITYDADILGTKTRVTEQLTFNETASFNPIFDPFIRPDGVSEGGWNQHAGCLPPTAHLCIDEIIRDDLDNINSTALGTNGIDEVNFTLSDASDPLIDTGHILRYTYRENNLGSNTPELVVSLYQGDTLIATRSELQPLPTTHTLATYTLDEFLEVPLITDYTNLKLGFNATCDGACANPGPTRDRVSVSWAELELPTPFLPISGLEAKEWGINTLSGDILDPRLLNFQESANIVAVLTYPIFANGYLEITISTDNGKVNSDSIIVT